MKEGALFKEGCLSHISLRQGRRRRREAKGKKLMTRIILPQD
jgi:hypothetical protein